MNIIDFFQNFKNINLFKPEPDTTITKLANIVNNITLKSKSINMDTVTISPQSIIRQKLSIENVDVNQAEDTKASKNNVNDKDYIESIIELGKSVEKIVDVDDFKWSAMVKLANTMGITGEYASDRIASLTLSDISNYMYEFGLKKESWIEEYVPAELIKQYATPENFWNDVFVGGKKNPDFQMQYVLAAPTVNIVPVGVDTDACRAPFDLKNASAQSILLLAQGIEENHDGMIKCAMRNLGGIENLNTNKMGKERLIEYYSNETYIYNAMVQNFIDENDRELFNNLA